MYGKFLKASRKKAGLSQEEMAWRMNTTQSSVSRMENNRLTLDIDSFILWVRITNTEVAGAALIFGLDIANTVSQILPMLNMIGGWLI